MPSPSRDFRRAAGQRLAAAEALFDAGHHLDAQYVGGYVVECSLKALILHRTPAADCPAVLLRITRGAAWHRADNLLGVLHGLPGPALPAVLLRRLRRFEWSTDLRYESGRRPAGETAGLLKTAAAVLDWVDPQLP